jgi:ribonuclease T1
MVSRRRTHPLVWVIVAFGVFVTALWQQRAENAPPSSAPAPAEVRVESRVRVPETVPATVPDTIPQRERAQLEATLALIERGGPFPYEKDGTVFMNREGRLPPQPRGYYREYTVPTPGAKNRGARRIVRGKAGETWYTRDHYRTFTRIDE